MKKMILFLLVFLFSISVCSASVENTFFIDIGTNTNQIGYKPIDNSYKGPLAISEWNNYIYILDNFNYKVNLYSKSGKFVESYAIPKKFTYFNIVVDFKGKVLLLTDKGQKLYQVSMLPKTIHTPYNLCVDNSRNFAISGLGNDGCTTGIIDAKQKFSLLKGYNTYLTKNGLIGLQTVEGSEGYLLVSKDKKIIRKLKMDTNLVSIGFTDEMNLYYVEPTSINKVKICCMGSTGKIAFKEVEFDPQLFYDEVIYQKLFCITSQGEVVMLNLDIKSKKLKVTVVNF